MRLWRTLDKGLINLSLPPLIDSHQVESAHGTASMMRSKTEVLQNRDPRKSKPFFVNPTIQIHSTSLAHLVDLTQRLAHRRSRSGQTLRLPDRFPPRLLRLSSRFRLLLRRSQLLSPIHDRGDSWRSGRGTHDFRRASWEGRRGESGGGGSSRGGGDDAVLSRALKMDRAIQSGLD